VKNRGAVFALCLVAGACAKSPLPPPNNVSATFDRSAQVIQVYVSNAQMPHDAWLVDATGQRVPLPLTMVSGPHINYTAPPSIGLGLGAFGWTVGGGAGVDVPLGSPRPTSVDDQYVATARVVAPSDYPQRWSQYHLAVSVGSQAYEIPAPAPS
jgi:hypothetical protein